MTELKQVGELQISEDVEFQRKEWRFERTGMVSIVPRSAP